MFHLAICQVQSPPPKTESPRKPEASAAAKPIKEEDLPLALAHRAVSNTGGKAGRRITIETNHFALQLGKLKTAVHYDVAIDPNLPKNSLRRVMEEFRRKHYPQRYPAFDGAKNLYSSTELPFGDQLQDNAVVINLNDRDKTYKVTVKFANYVDLSSLQTYFMSRTMNGDHLVTPQEAIQCIDVVLRSAPAVTCIPAGRSFFTKPRNQILRLGDGMEMYYGFYQSAVLGWKPFLNVDVAHKAFPISQEVTAVIRELYELDEAGLQRPQVDWYKLENYIKTLKVRYEIPNQPTSRKVYRVNGLGGPPQKEIFTPDGGQPISIFEYFRREKRFNLRYPLLPCLWVGNRDRKPRVLLPAELCFIVEGQDIKRKMNEIQTSKMIRYAATSTEVRKNKIMDATHGARYNDSPVIREFGFSVGNEFEQVDARILPPPPLLYNDKKTVMPGKGVWQATNNRFLIPATLSKWTIMCLDRRTRPDSLTRLASMVSTILSCFTEKSVVPFINIEFHLIKTLAIERNTINQSCMYLNGDEQ